jgi:glucan 1,3-beta-glucosidase
VDGWVRSMSLPCFSNITNFIAVTEPFIVPGIYEEYIGKSSIEVVDEWTLSQAMGSDLATRMEQHYKTFIVCRFFVGITCPLSALFRPNVILQI